MLDTIYREDHNQSCNRNSASNHSILQHVTLNAHNRLKFPLILTEITR